MSTTKFRLFEVTEVVYDEILSQLELNELFNLSLCSRRSMTRCHQRKSIRYPLFLDARKKDVMTFGFIRQEECVVMMSVRTFGSFKGGTLETVIIRGEKTQISRYDDHYATYRGFDQDLCDAYYLVLGHIIQLFPGGMHTLYCNLPWPLVLVGLLQKAALWMTYIGIEDEETVCLDWCGQFNTGGLELCSPIPQNFDFGLCRKYQYVRVKLWPHAVSRNVMKLAEKAKEVILDTSGLGSTGLNIFLNNWLENGCDGLKFLSIRMGEYQEAEALNGIRDRVSDTEEEVNYKCYTGEFYRLSPGKRLRRDDGVIASFYYDRTTRILNFGVVDIPYCSD